MDRLTSMELFVAVAELGTLNKAAESLEISNAAATRHIAALESRLNVRLIERSTRRLALTNIGLEYYKKCKDLLAEIDQAESSISSAAVEPEGTVTITSSISFAIMHLAPLISRFNKLYPKIKINLVGANRYYDIIDSNIDLAIRTREFEPDSNITIKKLVSTRRILAASYDYIKKRGKPKAIEELKDHDILLYSHANNPRVLNFTRDEEVFNFTIDPILETNDGQIVRAAALSGAGILIQPLYIIYQDIVEGRLIPILTDWSLPELTINIAFQSRQFMPIKNRLFIDFLIEDFKLNEYERYWNSIQSVN
ncbi:MAG: LysR family transcriptional regulator [Acinetobacter populi]|jgi:DNA-binding transcriptional LysR family regulator|uniref:LysR family transcriptional regulator n=1 Tax=Acinetobacter populi TaxID=1582270 RepID=UPI0023531ABB|nr:LysR family transcriptional regulator [Acinetobacter populi]MCH4248794.1 LysR family transcriptional regulator [Acinetobacter populi]